jgi:hypothetical protein
MSRISNPALDSANYYCSPLVAHNLLFLECTGTSKSSSIRIFEYHIDLLKLGSSTYRLSTTNLDSLFESCKSPNDGLLGIIDEQNRFRQSTFRTGKLLEYSILSVAPVIHQENRVAYPDCLWIQPAISNLVNELLGQMNNNLIKQSSIRNHSIILPRRSVWSKRATERHWLFQDHSRGRPLQFHLNPLSTNSDR